MIYLRVAERHLPRGSCHQTEVNAPTLTPARQTSIRFTYPRGMEGWVDLSGWLFNLSRWPFTCLQTVRQPSNNHL